MLAFANLATLLPHYTYISTKISLPAGKQFFFVGGSIRDLLLDIIKESKDLDLTCALHPDILKKCIDKTDISLFDTEKYGTITLIPKDRPTYQYEITPFRTETGYTDIRHPDTITRSESLVADSGRRDFTINAMYLTFVRGYTLAEPTGDVQRTSKTKQILKDTGFLVLPNQVLLLQSHTLIDNIEHIYTLLPADTIVPSTDPDAYICLLIDPQGGYHQLIEKEIQAVGDPLLRMGEDALRILRGARFLNTLNQYIRPAVITQNPPCYFDIENGTWKAMQKSFFLIQSLPKERLRQELMKVFSQGQPFQYMSLLDDLGLIPYLFPALERCKNIKQPTRYHALDLYHHTLLVLRALQERNDSPLLKFAALYHDVGKVDQYAYHTLGIGKEEKGSKLTGMMYHTNIGPNLVSQDFGKLGFSTKEKEEIEWYVLRHHRPGEILEANPKNRVKKIRELLSEGGLERAVNLLDLAIADRIGQINPVQPLMIDELIQMQAYIYELYAQEGQFTQAQLAINGNDVMQTFALPAGKELGELLQKSFLFARDNPGERNEKKVLLDYVKQLLKPKKK